MTILYILLVPFAILCVGAIIIAIVDYFKNKKRDYKEEFEKVYDKFKNYFKLKNIMEHLS